MEEFKVLLQIILIVPIVIILSVLWVFWTAFIGAGWQPTNKKIVKKMLDMANADSDDIIYDLGSGDGRIVVEAARRYHAKAIGVEADPIRVFWSYLVVIFSGLRKKVKIIWGNFFHQDISDATIVTIFLGDKANQALRKKFQDELTPGTRIVSYFWPLKGWMPVKIDDEKIFLYIVGQSN